MTSYEKWLAAEEEWIGAYCTRIRRQSVRVTVPLTMILLPVLLGGLSMVGGGSAQDAMYGALGGVLAGVIVCGVFLAVLLPGLNPKRFVRKIDKNVKALGMNGGEQELLAQEMLEADERRRISYTISGPGSKDTPGRFVLTPHFAFLAGSTPYSILVRLSDIGEIRQGQEKRTATQRSGNSRRITFYTLYTIGFYRKDRLEQGLTEKDLPNEAYGFFDAGIRNQVLELLRETGLRVS